MSRTWKVVLIILAFSIVCVMAACAFLFVWFPILGETNTREPTREEWAQSDKGDGRYLVGDDKEMAHGRWTHTSNKYGCSWHVSGMTEQGYKDNIESGRGKEVTLRDDMVVSARVFETSGCGTWHYQD